MTNTHRKTTNRTTARIAAVGAFGVGAAIAFPGLAAAQEAPEPGSLDNLSSEDGSLEDMTGEDGSLEGALGTEIGVDLGSLTFDLNLDAETPNPGSVELGSLGVSPNTGSELVDGGSGSAEDDAEDDAETGESGSLDTGSLPGSSEDETETGAATDEEETGSLSGALAGLSSEADDAAADDSATDTEETGTGSAA